MGFGEIVDAVRSKLKLGADIPNSAALTQELGNQLAMLNQNEKDTQALEAGLALDTIKSADRGRTTTDKLERLGKDRRAIENTVKSLRARIAEALDSERAAATAKQWIEARGLGAELQAAARAVMEGTDDLQMAVKNFAILEEKYCNTLPQKVPSEFRISGKLGVMITARLRSALPQIFGRPNGFLSNQEVARAGDVEAATNELIALSLAPATNRVAPNPGSAVLMEENVNA
jgi:hypothetical protein